MKKLAKVLAIVLTLGSTAVFASDTEKGKSNKSSEQKVSVSILTSENSRDLTLTAGNEKNEKVNVIIYDAFGETVFSETISSTEIHRNYNLAALPVGTYNIAVVSDNYSVNKYIEVK